MLSLLFLLSLFYLRFIPINMFWGMYFLFFGRNNHYKALYYQPLIAALIATSYLLALIVLATLPIALINYSIQDYGNSNLIPVLLTLKGGTDINFLGNSPLKDTLFSFLLAGCLCHKKMALVLKNLAKVIHVLAFVLIILGGIDVFNDYNSHVNPDIFDLLFPENGAVMFWGGIAVLTLVYFYLSFLTADTSLSRWKKRLAAIPSISPVFKYLVVSQSLLHPYFFLSPNGRRLVNKKEEINKKLILLLKKAFVENRDRIPEKWLN